MQYTKNEQAEIDNALDGIEKKKGAYKRYKAKETSSLLNRLAAIVTRKDIREHKKTLGKYAT